MEFRDEQEEVEDGRKESTSRPGSPVDLDKALPASLRRRCDLDAIREDILPYRDTTIDERSEIMSKLCRFAAEQVAAHPDGQRILEFQEQRSARSLALWRRLVAASRAT